MDISVVIATYNRQNKLLACLTAVSQQTCPAFEIFVIDDASTDNTVSMVQSHFPLVSLLQQHKNRGPATARNLGIKAAKGSIIVFTDDDCIPPINWLETLQTGFHRHPNAVGVSGFQAPTQEMIQKNIYARAENVKRLHKWGESALREQFGGYEVPGFGTNNAAYKRSILMEINGFDESFPVAAGEDADLKLRITQEGYRLLYVPLQVEHHREYDFKTQWRMSFRRGIGAYYFEKKHKTQPGLIRIGLRLIKRILLFIPDIYRFSFAISFINLISRLADTFGQLQAASSGNKLHQKR